MQSAVFIPRELRVGFQNRTDTYSGKLAYVTYTDEKGVHRKASSWERWRDKKIDPLTVENIPTSGFVFNKRAGGYKTYYDMRQSYMRVYDPRGFEFEITIPNLVYVLENASCIKGKGLEGEFVYGWSGTEILLIPVEAPDYVEAIATRDSIYDRKTFKAVDMVLGGTYKTRAGTELIYMGRFQAYAESWYRTLTSKGAPRGKLHFFYNPETTKFTATTSLSNLITGVSDVSVAEYAKLFEKLESQAIYSPHEAKNNVFVPFTYEEFEKLTSRDNYGYGRTFYSGGKLLRIYPSYNYRTPGRGPASFDVESYGGYRGDRSGYVAVIDAFNALNPQHLDTYLANGKFYRREY